MRAPALLVVLAAVLAASVAGADPILDRPATITNRQWVEARLAALSNMFTNQPRVTMVLGPAGTVDVNLYYSSTRLLQRQGKEREDFMKLYVLDPVQKGLNDILRTVPVGGAGERPTLAPTYHVHFLRSEIGQYVKVATGAPGALAWDAGAMKGFQKDLEGSEFPQGSLVTRYEISEAQWLGVQLALFSLQGSDPSNTVRCVISRERRVACRYDAKFERPKGGQAKEFYEKKRELVGRRVEQLSEELDRLFEREARETRFSSKSQLEWEITFDEGDGAFSAGRFEKGAVTWKT